MSRKLNGRTYSPPASRVPYVLIPTAVRWEALRASYFESKGELHKFQDCSALVRCYEDRLRNEAELPDVFM